MKGFLAGLVIGLILLPLGAYLYLRSGYAPVATSASPFPMERKLAHMALNARIRREMPANVPIEPTEANLLEGAKVYRDNCAGCHGIKGAPGPKTPAPKMYPSPPELLKGIGVTDDPAGETYWKVANGIRLSGMPAFSPSLDTNRMWQVSVMLAHADKLPASVNALLSAPLPAQ
jgi:mono/diheme cytochrome c family protein